MDISLYINISYSGANSFYKEYTCLLVGPREIFILKKCEFGWSLLIYY